MKKKKAKAKQENGFICNEEKKRRKLQPFFVVSSFLFLRTIGNISLQNSNQTEAAAAL